MADGRVAGRYVIKSVRNCWRAAAGGVGHRAARDEPHHQLDRLAAGLAHVVDVRHPRESGGGREQAIDEAGVPFLVDEAGAGPLQLMAHAPGSPDLDVERLVVALDRAPDGLPELKTAPARGHRVVDHVDGEGDHPEWPARRL